MLPVAGKATPGHQQGVNRQRRKREEGREMSVRIGRAGEEGKGEGRQGNKGSPLLLCHPIGASSLWLPSQIHNCSVFLFFASVLRSDSPFSNVNNIFKPRAAARSHEKCRGVGQGEKWST